MVAARLGRSAAVNGKLGLTVCEAMCEGFGVR